MTFDFDLTINLGVVLSVLAMFVAWFRTRRADLDERLKHGSDRMNSLDKRVQSCEQQIAAMPEKDDLHQLQLTLVQMAGKIDVISSHTASQRDVMKRLETVVTRHEDHLLEGSRK